MTKTFEVIVSPTGETKLETHGFAGDGCRVASQFLEQALGATVGEQLTAEFHQAQTAEQRLRQ